MTRINNVEVSRGQSPRSFEELLPQEKGTAMIRAYTHPAKTHRESVLLSDETGSDSAGFMRDLRARAGRFNERVWEEKLASVGGVPVGLLVRIEPLDRSKDARLEAYSLDGRQLASKATPRQH